MSASATLHAQEDTALKANLQALIQTHQGHVTLYACDLKSGKTVAINEDTPVPTASVIKLAVLFEALKQVQKGKAHFEDKLTLTKANQVEGSGVLMFFDAPQTLTLKDVLTMMIIVSDNTATNVAIDYLGLKNIDDRIQWLGLKDTWLYKKVSLPAAGPVPADQKQFGLGKTTAREMAGIMEHFATCNLNAPGSSAKPTEQDEKLCAAAMHMLKNQFYRNSIPRYLETIDTTEGESKIANKTGALDEVRNDVGVVFARNGPIVISEFTYGNQDKSWTPDNEAEVLLAKLAKTIVDGWQ
ncbi:serine hydrolase [Alloacidobacterium dinghuense]|uniref:Serine hydrolase n=2 Tax=Alloacidobacterium dinghuense TaxID=2763107 RepID=A0A7G8BQX3_9BACT|nr:serine hydrolase [Alloacidobacterium dinghuense]